MKTKLIPAMALSLMGFFATTSFAQEDVSTEPQVTAEEQATPSEAVKQKADKEDPRADRAKERFERKDAKKAEIANHKAEKQVLKEERAAARAERKAEKEALKEQRKAEKKEQKEERKSNKGNGRDK